MKKIILFLIFLCFITVGMSQNYVAGLITDDHMEIQVETSSPIKTQEFLLSIKNIGFSQITILWDECSITGLNNAPSKMILKENVNFTDYPQPETVIKPNEQVIVTVVPLNTIINQGIEPLVLTERTISMFFHYQYNDQQESLAARVKFPAVKEQSTFDRVFPWVMAGAGAALVLGIILWPRQ